MGNSGRNAVLGWLCLLVQLRCGGDRGSGRGEDFLDPRIYYSCWVLVELCSYVEVSSILPHTQILLTILVLFMYVHTL